MTEFEPNPIVDITAELAYWKARHAEDELVPGMPFTFVAPAIRAACDAYLRSPLVPGIAAADWVKAVYLRQSGAEQVAYEQALPIIQRAIARLVAQRYGPGPSRD